MLYILKSTGPKCKIAGSGSSVFAFKRNDDAMILARRIIECRDHAQLHFNRVGYSKYMACFYLNPNPAAADNLLFKVEQVPKNKLIRDMMDANVSVRIIEDVGFECGNVLVLNSQGPAFEPNSGRRVFGGGISGDFINLGGINLFFILTTLTKCEEIVKGNL